MLLQLIDVPHWFLFLCIGFSRCLQALVHWCRFRAARGESEWCIGLLLWCSNSCCHTSVKLLATFASTATDRQRVDTFLRRSKRCGFCPPDLPSFDELLEDTDDKLFNKINNNVGHLLHWFLPPSAVAPDGQTTTSWGKECTTYFCPHSLAVSLTLIL